MGSISFSISGQPQGFRVKGQSRIQSELKEEAKKQYEGRTLKGPLSLDVTFYIHPPQAIKKKIEEGQIIYPLRQPGQTDSMTHLVMRYLQHVAFNDPAQVVDLRARKIYDLTPRTEIQVNKIYN